MTKFFEPINASATHIHHSALELSPASSIVRKLYYDRCKRITLLPRVVVGTPDKWDQDVPVSSKDRERYQSCTWSPWGRFIAAQTKKAVEILSQCTLKTSTTLQPTEPGYQLTGPLAYAPDGTSLACASATGIVIWDIQTGGVAKEIKGGTNIISMAWSLDGRKIATTGRAPSSSVRVYMYDIASRRGSYVGAFLSFHSPPLWACEESFWGALMTSGHRSIQIFKIGSALAPAESLGISHARIQPPFEAWSFSPTTYRVSISTPSALYILDARSSNITLEEIGHFKSHSFSSEGAFFGASQEGLLHVWRYSPDRYHPWRKFGSQSSALHLIQFSPTLSSILGYAKNLLQVWPLHGLPTVPDPPREQYAGLSRSGNYIVTACKLGSTARIVTGKSLNSSTQV